jgi:hypothetical protein
MSTGPRVKITQGFCSTHGLSGKPCRCPIMKGIPSRIRGMNSWKLT